MVRQSRSCQVKFVSDFAPQGGAGASSFLSHEAFLAQHLGGIGHVAAEPLLGLSMAHGQPHQLCKVEDRKAVVSSSFFSQFTWRVSRLD